LIGRFLSADTVLPGAGNSQSYDRYSYVLNNPIRMIDPSGNVPTCSGGGADWYEGGNCHGVQNNYKKKTIIRQLARDYGWSVEGNWSVAQLQLISYTGSVIENRVDTLTGGYGNEWMTEYLGGANFKPRGSVLGSILGANDYTIGNNVNLHNNFGMAGTIYDLVGHLTHELGHVWDNHTSPGSVYIGGGVGDQYTRYLGGDPQGIRFINGTSGIPIDQQWSTYYPSLKHGDDGTSESFAFAFEYLIIDPSKLITVNDVRHKDVSMYAVIDYLVKSGIP
jgi:hypothetical protein